MKSNRNRLIDAAKAFLEVLQEVGSTNPLWDKLQDQVQHADRLVAMPYAVAELAKLPYDGVRIVMDKFKNNASHDAQEGTWTDFSPLQTDAKVYEMAGRLIESLSGEGSFTMNWYIRDVEYRIYPVRKPRQPDPNYYYRIRINPED